MQIGNRFRCYPTEEQKQILLRWIGCQRNIYNSKVAEDRYHRRFASKSLAHTGQYGPIDQQYSQFKSDLSPWLSEVPSQILRNGAYKWKQAYARYFQKLGGRPVIQTKSGKQSVWLTSELFDFTPVVDADSGEITGHTLTIGTPKFPLGILRFNAHKDFKPAASIHISVHAGRWHVSFNYDDATVEPSEEETRQWLTQFNATELLAMTVGLDRGVALPMAASTGQTFDFSDIQKKRLLAQEKHKKRWQRRQARRSKGSRNWVKAKHKVARYQRYGADVRRDVAHKASHTLAEDPQFKLFVLEAMKVKNMTKKAKPKQDEHGRWIKNGARAKSGLNKAILGSAWGSMGIFLGYKARRRGKLVIEVPAHFTSQECAACGHIHPDNRISQSEFVCQRCKHTDNADHNASKVIAKRGVRQLLDAHASGSTGVKAKKRCTVRKHKVGAVSSEPASAMLPTLGETEVSRLDGNITALWSLTQETHARRPQGV
jgi:putative transposase